MDELAANRVALLVLDHGRHRARALDLDVDQRAAVHEHVADVALADLEGARLRAAAVDDARNEAVAAQAPARARAELGSGLDCEGDAV